MASNIDSSVDTSDSESGAKREDSPLSKEEIKKPVSSEGLRLRRQDSAPDMLMLSSGFDKKSSKAKPKSVKPPTPVAFSDMVIHSFKDKSFREGISPVLADMLSPLIEKTVYATVTTAVKAATEGLKSSVAEGMNKSNKDLQDTVT